MRASRAVASPPIVDILLSSGSIPKTTSGKVQRVHLLSAYLDGEFSSVVAALNPSVAAVATDDDPLVAELITICAEFSKERSIGAEDNLFEVGVS